MVSVPRSCRGSYDLIGVLFGAKGRKLVWIIFLCPFSLALVLCIVLCILSYVVDNFTMADNIVGTLLVGVIVLGVVLVIASRSRNKKKPNPEDPSTTSTIRTSTPSRGSPTGSIPMGRKLRCSDAVYVDDSDFGNTSSLTSELRRDFARYFTSRTAVFLLNCRRKLPAQPIVPFHANVPNVDYVEASNMRTAADFREQLIRELGRHSDGDVSAEVIPDDTLNTAVIMCIRCMTITVGFKIAMSFRGASGMPMSLLQPAFVLVIGAGGRQCHVVTCVSCCSLSLQ